MKIYTKTGDRGETGLFGNVRVSKDDLRIEAYGSIDELNASLGLVLSEELEKLCKERLLRIQGELFQLGAELATPPGKKVPTVPLQLDSIERLEREIDEMEKTLPPLKNFILPGGGKGAALLHQARTICRRAERAIITLEQTTPCRTELLAYINRLSDYLFVTARAVNLNAGNADVPWVSP